MCSLRKREREKRNKIAPNISHRKELIRLIVFHFCFCFFCFIPFYFIIIFLFRFFLYVTFLPFCSSSSVTHCLFLDVLVRTENWVSNTAHIQTRIKKSNKLFWILANIVNNSCGIAFESWRHKRAHEQTHRRRTRENDSNNSRYVLRR